MIAHPLYAASGNGWIEADTSQPFTAPGFYSRPYVPQPTAGAQGRLAAILKRSIRLECRCEASKSSASPRPEDRV